MQNAPYKSFGLKLKQIRTSAKESLADVCGAVETDMEVLKNLEAGTSQPSEDLVLLLISHFALKDEDALHLWELAGYSQEKTGMASMGINEDGVMQKTFVASGDVRILYTDMVHIKANKHGVVVNFLQSLGTDDHTMAVSRIGMSIEHAHSLLDLLQQTLKATNKSPKQVKKTNKKSSNDKNINNPA